MSKVKKLKRYQIAENWAVSQFDLRLAKRNQAGYDGVFPDGRKVEIKSKKYGAHSDAGTYVDLSESKLKGDNAADCLLVVFVDYKTNTVVDHILSSMERARQIANIRTVYRITISDLKKIAAES